jgi:hypothetical protein
MMIPGLSPSVHRQLQNYEMDSGLALGQVAEAYDRYRRLALRGRPTKQGRDWTPDDGYDWRADPDDPRTVIELAMRSISPRARRQLRALISPLDEAYQAWSLPNPFVPSDIPWWVGRFEFLE